MAKSKERLKAIALRREGASMKAIASILGVCKSSVSLWVRDVVLTKYQREKLRAQQISAGHRGRLLGAQ